jgi:hypothetical protein
MAGPICPLVPGGDIVQTRAELGEAVLLFAEVLTRLSPLSCPSSPVLVNFSFG